MKEMLVFLNLSFKSKIKRIIGKRIDNVEILNCRAIYILKRLFVGSVLGRFYACGRPTLEKLAKENL